MRFWIIVKLTLFIAVVALCLSFLNEHKDEKKVTITLDCKIKPNDWDSFITKEFVFSKPSDLTLISFDKVDSSTWKLRNEKIDLMIDLGNHSGFVDTYRSKPNYIEQKIVINEIEATLISFESYETDSKIFNQNKFTTVLFFSRSEKTQNNYVAYWFNYKETEQRSEICAILNSIEFQNNYKK